MNNVITHFVDHLRWGRKTVLLLGAVPIILSWILIIVTQSVELIYVSRVLSGLSYGVGYSITPIYLGEIASDKVRGSVSTLMSVMVKCGILFAYSIGPYVSFRWMASIALIVPSLFVLTFSWLPESPYYYLGKENREAAFKSLASLRQTENIQNELDKMHVAVQKSKENKGTFRDLFFVRGNRKSLIIILGLGTVQQLSGSQAVIAYSQTIFEKVGAGMGASEATILLGIVQVITAFVSALTIDVFGRRPLLLASVAGAAVCNSIIGVYFYFERSGTDVSAIAWIPMVALMTFITSYGIGMGTATFTVLGEIFPKNIKAVAAASYMINTSIFQLIVTKLFQVVSDGWGIDYTFIGFAIFSYAFIPFVWFLVPETKGKPLDEILVLLNSHKSNKKTSQIV